MDLQNTRDFKSLMDGLPEAGQPTSELSNESLQTSMMLDRRNYHAGVTTKHIQASGSKKRTGLKNLGNTCYMNCIMQCLANLPDLIDYFKSESFNTDIQFVNDVDQGNIISTLATSITAMNSGMDLIVDLSALKATFGKQHPAFKSNDQQDAHEWLTKLLYSFNPQFFPDSYTSKLSQLFGGYTRSRVKCQQCRSETVSTEPFLILSIPIPSQNNQKNRFVDLQDCFELYTAKEIVGDWTCDSCQTHGTCIKTMEILHLPLYLIIHLQRFDNSFNKLETEIMFQTDGILDLSSKVRDGVNTSSESQFQLRGLCNHYGTNLNGHYTAYCRDISNEWWSCDDEQLSILRKDANSKAAYILFYENVTTKSHGSNILTQPSSIQISTTVHSSRPSSHDISTFNCKVPRCGRKFHSEVPLIVHMDEVHQLPPVSLLENLGRIQASNGIQNGLSCNSYDIEIYNPNQSNVLTTTVGMDLIDKNKVDGEVNNVVEIVDVLGFPSHEDATVKAYMCPECKKSFTNKKAQARHVKSVHSGTRYACTKCDKNFKNLQTLQRHNKSVHKGIRYACPKCTKTFTERYIMKQHLKAVHEGIEKPRKSYACPKCDESFTASQTLKHHIQSMHEGKRHPCPKCKKSFSDKNILNRHLKSVHDGTQESQVESRVPSHPCPKCERTFVTNKALQLHVKSIHEKLRYVCPQCGKAFTVNFNLQRHIKSFHQGIRYACPLCEITFADAKTMLRHVQSEHGNMRHQCPKCEKTCGDISTLQKHIKCVHEGRRYACSKCIATFVDNVSLQRHLQSVHEGKRNMPQTSDASLDPKKSDNKKLEDTSGEKITSSYQSETKSIWSQIMDICFS